MSRESGICQDVLCLLCCHVAVQLFLSLHPSVVGFWFSFGSHVILLYKECWVLAWCWPVAHVAADGDRKLCWGGRNTLKGRTTSDCLHVHLEHLHPSVLTQTHLDSFSVTHIHSLCVTHSPTLAMLSFKNRHSETWVCVNGLDGWDILDMLGPLYSFAVDKSDVQESVCRRITIPVCLLLRV